MEKQLIDPKMVGAQLLTAETERQDYLIEVTAKIAADPKVKYGFNWLESVAGVLGCEVEQLLGKNKSELADLVQSTGRIERLDQQFQEMLVNRENPLCKNLREAVRAEVEFAPNILYKSDPCEWRDDFPVANNLASPSFYLANETGEGNRSSGYVVLHDEDINGDKGVIIDFLLLQERWYLGAKDVSGIPRGIVGWSWDEIQEILQMDNIEILASKGQLIDPVNLIDGIARSGAVDQNFVIASENGTIVTIHTYSEEIEGKRFRKAGERIKISVQMYMNAFELQRAAIVLAAIKRGI